MAVSNEQIRAELIRRAKKWRNDPLSFVKGAFPWGKGTLTGMTGPDKWQTQLLTHMRDRLNEGDGRNEVIQSAVAAGHGVGKALDVDLVVDTPLGKKRWGDLKVGDTLYAPDGTVTKIVAIPYRGIRECFRVSFDDGSSTIASGEHLWTVQGRQSRRKGLCTYETLTTKEILERGVIRSNGASRARQWALPSYEAVLGGDSNLPIAPYLLGVWLGNGDSRGRLTTNDREVIERLKNLGIEFSLSKKHGTTCLGVYPYGLKVALDRLGISEGGSLNKRFPVEVYGLSTEDRWELLRGLIDTDGEVTSHSGCVIYSTISKRLADDVVWLARSLGGKARIAKAVKHAFYIDKDGNRVRGNDCYRVSMTLPRGNRVAYVERKQERIRTDIQQRYLTRWIDSIESIGERECMCVTVDRTDGLFLANDFIVTHNSGLVAWIILWAISTYPDTRGVVTANTDTQLRTKTWAELAKWYHLCVFRVWFELTATAIISKQPGHDKTWRIDAIPWSESNPEAFAGLHNQGKRLLVIFDEASAIADKIWEVIEGAMTDKDTQILWFAFGNPTRSIGRFFDCFNKFRHRWNTKHVDARDAAMGNKAQIQAWLEDYGEDSDFFKVRVRGVFPSTSDMQFIGRDIVDGAVARTLPHVAYTQCVAIMGVDVARFGGDASVIRVRLAQDARTMEKRKYRGLDGWALGAKVAEWYNELMKMGVQRIVINVDSGGVGASPCDWLRNNGYPVNEINFGSAPTDARRYKNLRAEMWGRMREWLKAGGCIADDQDLITDLTAVEYTYTPVNQILLEKKEDMKKRGLASPDDADSLALTFAIQMNEYIDSLPSPERRANHRRHTTRDPYR